MKACISDACRQGRLACPTPGLCHLKARNSDISSKQAEAAEAGVGASPAGAFGLLCWIEAWLGNRKTHPASAPRG